MVDAADLKSVSLYREWGFESLSGHTILQALRGYYLLELDHVYSGLYKNVYALRNDAAIAVIDSQGELTWSTELWSGTPVRTMQGVGDFAGDVDVDIASVGHCASNGEEIQVFEAATHQLRQPERGVCAGCHGCGVGACSSGRTSQRRRGGSCPRCRYPLLKREGLAESRYLTLFTPSVTSL